MMISELLGTILLVSTSYSPDSLVLKPSDVPAIATVAIEVALEAARRFEGDVPEPVAVDVDAGHAVFERWSGRSLTIDPTGWLREASYGRRATFDALNCPTPNHITPACRFRGAGTLLRVWRIEQGRDKESLDVYVDVLHARGGDDSRLGGLTAVVSVGRENGSWRALRHRLQVP